MTKFDPQRVYEWDKRCAEFCRTMQTTGFRFDAGRAAEIGAFLSEQSTAALKACWEAAGREFLPSSRQQLWKVLSDLGAPPLGFTDAGAVSTKAEVMHQYAVSRNESVAALAAAVLRFRGLGKAKDYLTPHVGADARVHPSWNASGQVASRWGVSDPNLMQMPTPRKDPTYTHFEGGLKGLYCAEDGKLLVMHDVEQLEFRVAAYMSGDKALIGSCLSGDPHSGNSELVFGDAFRNADDELRKRLRTISKSFTFAICYRGEVATVHARLVSEGLQISLRETATALNILQQKARHYFDWQDACLDEIRRTGYVYTPILGRRRYLSHDPSATEAANFPIQGGGAEVVAGKILDIAARCEARKLPARSVAYEYDSLVMEVDEDSAEEVASVMKEVYDEPVRIGDYDVVFPIKVEICKRWS